MPVCVFVFACFGVCAENDTSSADAAAAVDCCHFGGGVPNDCCTGFAPPPPPPPSLAFANWICLSASLGCYCLSSFGSLGPAVCFLFPFGALAAVQVAKLIVCRHTIVLTTLFLSI